MDLRERRILITTAMRSSWQPISPSWRGERVNGVTWSAETDTFLRQEKCTPSFLLL